jgi:hypothetical protein
MKAYVSIHNYGDKEVCEAYCRVFNRNTLFHAYLDTTYIDRHVIVIKCRAYELGQLFAAIQADPLLNWVEYTVQFDCA